MAEVFTFNDLKEEGSEAAVKVFSISHSSFMFAAPSAFTYFRLPESIDNKANFVLLKMVISSFSYLMPVLALQLAKTLKKVNI